MIRLRLLSVVVSVSACFGVALAGDISAGKAVFNGNACIGCHGEGGLSQVDTYPILAGRSADYITTQLTKFRSQQRINATMNAMASNLSDSDILNVAAYLAAQKGPAIARPKPQSATSDK